MESILICLPDEMVGSIGLVESVASTPVGGVVEIPVWKKLPEAREFMDSIPAAHF
jgi:hypothetical protein